MRRMDLKRGAAVTAPTTRNPASLAMPRLLRPKVAAAHLDVTEAHLLQLARDGIVPCVRLGRRVLFSETALRDFVESGGKAFAGGWRKQMTPGSNT